MDPELRAEVESRLAEIQSQPELYAPYDLDGDGRMDEQELERLRAILAAEVRRTRTTRPPGGDLDGVIAQRYELLRPLGIGGQARTYLARDRDTGEQVVVKQLLLAHLENWKAIELFKREGQVLRDLEHVQIPSYLGAFHETQDSGERFFLIQEYVEGETLGELIGRGVRFEEPEVRAFLDEVLGILEYLHAQNPPVVHRDIKPSNLIRRVDGSWALIDFGAIQAVLSTASMVGSTIVGTSGYMSPEQFMGRSVPATDLYALGATTIHMLSHVHPGELALSHMRLQYHERVAISAPMLAWLDRCVEPMTERRFATVTQARDALAELDRQLVATPPDRAEGSEQAASRPPAAVPILVGAACVVAAAVFFMVTASPHNDHTVSTASVRPGSRALIEPPTERIVWDEVVDTFEMEQPKVSSTEGLSSRQEDVHEGRTRFERIPIHILPGVGLEPGSFEITRGIAQHQYKQQYEVGLALKNTSTYAYDVLEFAASGVNAAGKVLTYEDDVDAIYSFRPWIQPGESAHFNFSISVPEGTAALVLAPKDTLERALRPEPKDTPHPLLWDAKKPEGVEFEMWTRDEGDEAPTMGRYRHEAAVVLEHTGSAPVRLLELEKRAFDGEGNLVAKENAYVIAHNEPYFRAGDRLHATLNTYEGEKTERIEIAVIGCDLAEPLPLRTE
jgi:serine/threonine protein kinase